MATLSPNTLEPSVKVVERDVTDDERTLYQSLPLLPHGVLQTPSVWGRLAGVAVTA